MKTSKVPLLVLPLALVLVMLQTATQASAQGTPLTLGATNSGTISLPSQADRFTFTGSAGQRLYFDTFDLDGDPIYALLSAPSGAVLWNIGSWSDTGPFYLKETGTYTLTLDAVGDATGDYSFRVVNLASAPPINYGATNAGQLAPHSRTEAYSFSGTNGQRLNLRSIAASSSLAYWRLVSPANQTLAGIGTIDGDLGEVVLPATGTYLILVEGHTENIGTLDFQFAVSLLSNASGATSGFGTVRSGIVLADQTNTFTYTAPAGLPVFFDALTNIAGATVQLVSPAGEVVFTVNSYSDGGPFVLPRSGSYTLNVIAGASDTEYLFRVVDLNASAIPITLGTVYSQNFAAVSPFRTDVYRFTGAVGQRIYYDSLEYDYNASSTLYRPDGQAGFYTYYDGDLGPLTLDQPGNYYLILANLSADPDNDYLFRVLDAAQSPAAPVGFDTVVNGANAYGSEVSLYRFDGTARQRLFFDAAGTNAAGSWYLYGPDDTYLSGVSSSADFEVNLPASGQYLLVVGNSTDTNAASFNFRIMTPPTTNSVLTLGAIVSGTLTEAGEEDRFTFTGTLGQRLYYDALQTDFENLIVLLLNPAGAIAHISGGNTDLDVGPFTLTESGEYTLVLKASTETIGDYQFRLIDVAQSPAAVAAFDTPIHGTNTPAVAASVYRFVGTAGQRLFIGGTGTNAGNLTLYRPDNAYVNSTTLNNYYEVTLTQNGTYVLVAGNLGETNPAAFSFRIVTPNTTTTALTLGATVNGTLVEPGEEDRFTFTGAAGQRLLYDGLQADYESLTAQLLDPFGAGVHISGNSDSDVGVFTLSVPGTYTLALHAPSETTGNYSFRLLDLAAGPLVTYGTTVSNELNPQISAQLYRISGTAGQRIGITNLGASAANANWSLLNPANTVLRSDNIMNSLGEVTLPSTGTYALVVAGNADLIGGLTYQFNVSLISSASGAVSGFGAQHSGDTIADQTNTFSYSGPAGRVVYFDSLTNSSPTTIRLIDPTGEAVFSIGGGSDSGPYFLPRNGSYTLEVVGYADGSYDFRLLDLAAATNVILGTTYSQVFSPALRADLYRFDATNGQRIYYDSESVNYWYQHTATLYSPSGTSLGFVYSQSDMDSLVLTDTGTYYLALNGLDPTDGLEYAFRVMDAAQSPATALVLDTTVNGTAAPGTAVNLYRFAGTAGQKLFFDATPTNAPGYWSVYGPNSTYIGGNSLPADFELTLPQTGQYMLAIGNSGDTNPSSYSIQVITPNTTSNALVMGAITAGSLVEVGEEDWFTFTAIAGQRLYYDGLDGDGDNLQARLTDPLGNVLFDVNAELDSEPFMIVATGTYALRLKHSSDGTGNYQFRLLDTATASTLALDTVISGLITNTYGAQLFHVPLTPNLRLILDGLGVVDGLGNQRLYGQNNALIASGSLGTDIESTPTYGGNYLLVLRSTVSTNLPYSFQIIPGNHAPVLASIGNRTNNEMTLLSFAASATDLEAPNDQLAFSLDPGAPAAAAIHPVTGVFTWTPDETNGPGIYPVTIRVTDNGTPNFSDAETFNITVNEVNRAPSLTGPADQVVNELIALNLSASATDPDVPTNVLTFSLVSPPSGMTINPASGAIAWTPSELQGPFTNTITVVVADTNPPAVNAKQLSTTNTFVITVRELNVAPVLPVQTNRTINELTLLNVTNTATDSDLPANGLGYVLTEFPPGATITTNGIITWTPTEAQGPGSYTFTTVVTDTNLSAINAQNLTATNTFVVTVNEVNVAPGLPIQTNRTINELTLLTVTNTATDSDLPANGLGYTLTQFPPGATISSNGVINWTPTEAQGPGNFTFTTVVTDTNLAAVNAQNLTMTNTFTVTVNEMNVAPVLTLPADQGINEMVFYSNNATATDADSPANPLVFALVSGPAGLTVSSAGTITWTPTEAQGPGVYPVQISVRDTNPPAVNATSLSVTGSFTLTVNEVNLAPTLLPPASRTIHAGTSLSLSALATDPDSPANTFTYAKVAGPAGVGVNSAGSITWNTSDADANTTNAITLKVTDSGAPNLNNTNSFIVTVVSRPTFISIQRNGGSATAVWTAISGTSYRLQYRTNIGDTAWGDLAGDVPAGGPTATKTDSTLGTNATRFYRVFVLP